MKAILVDEQKNLVWSAVENPVIKADEALVKIHAATLNRADLLQRQGKYPSPPGCPEWMGLEIAGVSEKVGESVTDWKIGDRVCALLGGGYWIVISTLAGIETNVLLRPLLTKGLHLVGSMLRNRTPEFKAYILSELVKHVWPKIESGEIRPAIYRVLPIEQAAEAHAILERGENIGKVVLRVCSDPE
ncbi:MAG: zinc-binding dehydrogenase [Clostridiales bacterium]|nr:zinc-binding dehydrogenase [Clostridiales bacterium]